MTSLKVARLEDQVSFFVGEVESLKNSIKTLKTEKKILARELAEEKSISAKWCEQVAEANKKINKLNQLISGF